MAGFLTTMFDGVDGGQSSSGAQHLGISDEVAADPSVSIAHSESVQFDDVNGTTHSFSNDQDLTVDVGMHAVLAVAGDTAQGAFTGDGFEE